MFQKELSLGAKALLSYQISLLKEQSPLQKPIPRSREKGTDISVENAGSQKVGKNDPLSINRTEIFGQYDGRIPCNPL